MRHPGLHFAAVFLLFALAGRLSGGELTVDPQKATMSGFVTINVTLEGAFADVEDVKIPLKNLVLTGEPSVSSEFSWINGESSRRKTFRYRARPLAPGAALVGPIVVTADGRSETLVAAAIEIAADRVHASNDPEAMLRELRAEGRPLIFLVAELDRRDAFAGEQVIVTWSAYNASAVQQWQLVDAPKMPDFWIEEFPQSSKESDRVWVGDQVMQKVTVRRAAIYPLRAGTFEIGRMTVEAAVLEPIRRGPFSIFEGNLEDVTVTSAPLTIVVKPLPQGTVVSAVGDFRLECGAPFQRNGPVVVPVTLSGVGNLRGAAAPQFEGRIRGDVQIEGGDVALAREPSAIRMSRQWRYLIFPSASGRLEIPPLSVPVFSTTSGSPATLRCAGTTLDVTVQKTPALPGEAPPEESAERASGPSLPILGGIVLAVAFAALAASRLRREVSLRRRAREIVSGATPAEIRSRVEKLLPTDAVVTLAEHSDRGDAWRALRSLLDAAERDRDIGEGSGREIERRVREMLALL